MTTLHIGRHRVQTISSSDNSTVPAGSVTVASSASSVVQASVDPVTNNVTVSGIGAGSATVTYAATGFQSTVEAFTVAPLPTLVVTDGPEQ